MKKLFIYLFAILPLIALAQTSPTNDIDRATLTRQLKHSIPLEFDQVESTLPQINILLKKGEKSLARTMVDEALQKIAKIEADQKTLAQIDENVDEEALMINQVQETKRYLVSKANLLRNAIGIYIVCDAKLFEDEYPTFLKDIQGELSKFGVTFVDSVQQADWAIYLSASSREYNKMDYSASTTYFSYVDTQLTIDKISNGKRVFENTMSEKGGHTINYEQAARDAYKKIAPKISAIIKEQIQQ